VDTDRPNHMSEVSARFSLSNELAVRFSISTAVSSVGGNASFRDQHDQSQLQTFGFT
jgi:hypothetical protein